MTAFLVEAGLSGESERGDSFANASRIRPQFSRTDTSSPRHCSQVCEWPIPLSTDSVRILSRSLDWTNLMNRRQARPAAYSLL